MSEQTKAWRFALNEACDLIDSLESRLENLEEVYALSCDQRESLESRLAAADLCADILKTWVKWWNGPGRIGYRDPLVPPLTKTSEVLHAYDDAWRAAKGKEGGDEQG